MLPAPTTHKKLLRIQWWWWKIYHTFRIVVTKFHNLMNFNNRTQPCTISQDDVNKSFWVESSHLVNPHVKLLMNFRYFASQVSPYVKFEVDYVEIDLWLCAVLWFVWRRNFVVCEYEISFNFHFRNFKSLCLKFVERKKWDYKNGWSRSLLRHRTMPMLKNPQTAIMRNL